MNTYFANGNSTSYPRVASFSERWCIRLGSLDTRGGSGAQPSLGKIASLFAPSLLACCRFLGHLFRIFCVIPGPIFGPFFGPEMRPGFGHFNCKRISGLKSGPNFGSHFGYHFWGPKSATFFASWRLSWTKFWSLGLALGFSLICNGQRWQDPMLRMPMLLLCWFRGMS